MSTQPATVRDLVQELTEALAKSREHLQRLDASPLVVVQADIAIDAAVRWLARAR